MKKRYVFFLVAIASTFLSSTFRGTDKKPDNSPYKTKYVVVLVIDGPRYSETYGDSTCKYIPRLGKELIHEGVFFADFKNNGPTYTNSGHTAITTGVYQRISNAGKELPKNPSFFQYYLKESGNDKSTAWLVSSKGKLEILANTKSKKWWNMYMPSTYCGSKGNSADYVGDMQTYNKVLEIIDYHKPKVMLINFLAVDATAHQNEWEEYLRSIQQSDEFAFQVWKAIQADSEMKDRTTLFITNDHGRHVDGHKNGFVNHGDKCAGCRKISLLAIGPDFKKDTIVQTPGELIDISATVAELMRFSMPTTKGRVLREMFN